MFIDDPFEKVHPYSVGDQEDVQDDDDAVGKPAEEHDDDDAVGKDSEEHEDDASDPEYVGKD